MVVWCSSLKVVVLALTVVEVPSTALVTDDRLLVKEVFLYLRKGQFVRGLGGASGGCDKGHRQSQAARWATAGHRRRPAPDIPSCLGLS